MPIVEDAAGYSSSRASIKHEGCESQLCALGNGDSGIILSKSSLTREFDQVDTSALVDFFGGPGSASLRSRISASFFGEPATPNGAGDCAVVSYSPAARGGYCYGQQPSAGVRGETPSDNSNLTRRSCSFESDDASAYCRRSAPVPAVRGSRFLSGIGAGPEPASSALSATTVLGAATPCLDSLPLNSSSSHTQWLEQVLRDQCEENQRLRRQVREQDEQLSALREELSRLAGGLAQAQAPSQQAEAAPDTVPPPPGLLAQLQNAREKLSKQGRGAAADDGAEAEQPPTPLAPALDSAAPGPAGVGSTIQLDERPQDPPLIRLDTPSYTHEALRPVRSLSGELQAVNPPTAAPDSMVQPRPQPAPDAVAAITLAPPPPQGDDNDGSSSSNAAGCGVLADGGGKFFPAFDGVAAPDCSPGIHPLLVAERRRTDRAHSALLCSSRQAARLAEQLAEAKYVAEQLGEELRDWRRACLENHRELVKLRKAAAATGKRLMW